MPADLSRSYRAAFWGAVIITVAAWLLPFGGMAIYPLSLLATWAHELGHGLAALTLGGEFRQMEIHAMLSGLARVSVQGQVADAAVSAAGLLGAPLLGVAIIACGVRPRWSRGLLLGLGVVILVSVALWVRNLFGQVALSLLGIGVIGVAIRLSPRGRFIAVQLTGIQLALSSVRSYGYLFAPEANRGTPSDTASIAQALGGTYWMWGALILALELGLLYGAYRLVQRRLRREQRLAASG